MIFYKEGKLIANVVEIKKIMGKMKEDSAWLKVLEKCSTPAERYEKLIELFPEIKDLESTISLPRALYLIKTDLKIDTGICQWCVVDSYKIHCVYSKCVTGNNRCVPGAT
jgi:hypothetical protein